VGAPAIVQGDRITGICNNHLMPSASGTQPAGPRTFSAPIIKGIEPTVLIGNKPAAVINASGINTDPSHGGLADAYATPATQVGGIVTGSPTVLIRGKSAATVASQAHCCLKATPGKVGPGVSSVLIG